MDETWSTITAASVLVEFTPIEQATLQNIQGATTNLASIVTGVINQVRNAYQSGGRELDATATTIPVGEQERAIAIARWKWLTSLPLLKSMQTADRKSAYEEAEKYFAQIAKREQKGSGGAEIVSQNTRRATRTKMDGLN